MNKLKIIWPVLAGFLTVVILSIATDVVLEGIGLFPPASQGLFDPILLLIALSYRTAYAFAGGYVTGKLAKSNPAKHVKALLVVGIIMGLLGVVAGWNLSQHWYPNSLVITSALGVWYGGKMGMKKK